MEKNLLFVFVVLLVPSFTSAHVSVCLRESKLGVEKRSMLDVRRYGTHEVVLRRTVLRKEWIHGSEFRLES